MGLLDGLFGNARKQGQNAFKNVIMTGASASKNETVQSVARQMVSQPSPSNQTRAPQPRPIATPINTEKKTPPRVFNPADVPIAAAKAIIGATPFGVAHQAMKHVPKPLTQVQKPQTTPFDGAFAATKPVYEWGKGASLWWDKNAAPVLKNATDALPYLGPAHIPVVNSEGKPVLVPAEPLSNGGTRLRPYGGNPLARGALINFPKHTIEFATAVPAAVSYLGQETWKDPAAAPGKLAAGAVFVAEEMATAAKENPAEFIGEMGAGVLLGGKGVKVGLTAAKTGVKYGGEAVGLVRKKTYGFTGAEKIPYLSPAEEVQAILESPTVSGVRATPHPAGTFLPTRRIRVRNPGEIGDVPTGDLPDIQGAFMTLSRTEIEPHGTYFLTKSGGIKGALGGKRVYLQEDIRTVQVPDDLKLEIYDSIRTKGEFWGDTYNRVLNLAKEQSAHYGEPVAVPSPKRAKGIMQPENEAFLVFGAEEATKITQTRWAGFSPEGVLVKRIRYGKQAPIKTGRLESILENIDYNWDIGRSGTKLYNRNYLKAMSHDMARKAAEIYGDAVSYPGSYAGHGKGHAAGVYTNLIDQWSRSPQLQSEASLSGLWLRAKYHDIAKIYDFETQPLPHSFAASEAIRTGMFRPADLLDLSPKQRDLLALDIQTHTDIMPGFGRRGILTKTLWRPTNVGKALATADRMDLARFGVTPKKSKLFDIPEDRLDFQIKSFADDVVAGRQDLPVGFQTKNVPLTDAKLSEIAGVFSPKNAPIKKGAPKYSYSHDTDLDLSILEHPAKNGRTEYKYPSDVPPIVSLFAYPGKKASSAYAPSGYPSEKVTEYLANSYPQKGIVNYPVTDYPPKETVNYPVTDYPPKETVNYPVTDYPPKETVNYPVTDYPPKETVGYPAGSPLSLLPPTPGPSLPKETKPKKHKKQRPRRRDPYDWIVGNPVHDIDSFFGLSEAPRQKKKSKNPADILLAPSQTKKGKPRQARHDPLAAPGKDFFEVKF